MTKNTVQRRCAAFPDARVHECAVDVLKDLIDHLEKVYAVATSGWAFAKGQEHLTEANLFTVLEDLAGQRELTTSLRNYLDELGTRLGVDTTAAEHGGEA